MNSTAGTAPPPAVLGLGLDTGGPWHQRAVQKSRALARTYLLSSSVTPLLTTGGNRVTKTPLRLPSLAAAKGPHRQAAVAPLSFSEPSLFTPGEKAVSEGFSHNRRRSSSLRKRPPPPPPLCRLSPLSPCSCKTCQTHVTHQRYPQNHHQDQSCSRPVYIHFSQPIQPGAKPVPAKPYSQNLSLSTEVVQGDPRPLVMRYRHSLSQGEALSVIGKPCLLSCSQPPTLAVASAPARTQLHVFLPTEGEGQEVDSESVDEGFMDELDSKITSLKLQQGGPKAVTYH